MKTFLVYPPGAPLAGGGLWRQVRQTAEALRSLGVEAVAGAPVERDELKSYDLCHVFGAHIGTYHFARELYRKGMPLVVSPVFFSRHSSFALRAALGVQRILSALAAGVWIDYRFTADICRWASAVVPNTQAEAALLRQGLGVDDSKITVVPNGVEPRFENVSRELFRERYGVKDFVLNVGYLGSRRKNTLRLIRALHRIDVPAVIIGDPEDAEYYAACRREAARNERLRIIEGLPPDSELLASAYAACDVFVLPSLYETPGIAALEAALAGAKIVITKYGGTREYFADLAEYVEPTSEHSIASGISAALHRKKDSKLRDRVRDNYLWSKVGEKTLAVYNRVLAAK